MTVEQSPDGVEARDRSYGVRQVLANRLGKREHQDFQCRVPVTLDNGHELTLLSTSNAGFEGITGHFVDAQGVHYNVSLGHVVAWTV